MKDLQGKAEKYCDMYYHPLSEHRPKVKDAFIAGYTEAINEQRELAIAFAKWVEEDSWYMDYADGVTHSDEAKFDWFIKNVYKSSFTEQSNKE